MDDANKTKKEIFQSVIISYWEQKGRHDLPWRKTDDPWQLLVAEILLRKTTSEQAVEVFGVLSKYTPREILNVEGSFLEDILRPIGIYKVRAEQLKSAALFFDSNANIRTLSDEELRSLKGVGRYISNMVRCITSGAAVPALDSNMIRVLTRYFGYISNRKRAREDQNFWKFAETLVPIGYCKEFNWGVLDFGADICTFYKPKCLHCPLSGYCSYFQNINNSCGAIIDE